MKISYRVKSGTGKTWTQSGLSLYEGAAIPGHRFSSLSVPSKCRFCGVEEVVDVVSDLQEKRIKIIFFILYILLNFTCDTWQNRCSCNYTLDLNHHNLPRMKLRRLNQLERNPILVFYTFVLNQETAIDPHPFHYPSLPSSENIRIS